MGQKWGSVTFRSPSALLGEGLHCRMPPRYPWGRGLSLPPNRRPRNEAHSSASLGEGGQHQTPLLPYRSPTSTPHLAP